MDIDKVKVRVKGTGRKVNINLKISEKASKWLRDKDYSPTGVFNEAMRELGFVEGETPAKPEAPHPQSYEANKPQ